MSTLTILRARLTAVQNKILEILETGEEYTITGAFTVRNPKILDLEAEESLIRKKILLAKGYDARTYPNFS